jgi:hypothetical protein
MLFAWAFGALLEPAGLVMTASSCSRSKATVGTFGHMGDGDLHQTFLKCTPYDPLNTTFKNRRGVLGPSLSRSYDLNVAWAPEPKMPQPHHSSYGIERRDRGSGHRLVGENDAELGYKALSVRIFD